MVAVVLVLLVGLGVASGAGLRMAIDRAVERRWGARFAIDAVGVHLGGCAVLGFVVGLPSAFEWADPISVICSGVFVGYAVGGVETVRLLRQASFRAPALAAARVLSALAVGSVGMALAGLLTPN
jgi:fluoride ion exporter CrcB/FEX